MKIFSWTSLEKSFWIAFVLTNRYGMLSYIYTWYQHFSSVLLNHPWNNKTSLKFLPDLFKKSILIQNTDFSSSVTINWWFGITFICNTSDQSSLAITESVFFIFTWFKLRACVTLSCTFLLLLFHQFIQGQLMTARNNLIQTGL